MIFFVCLGFIWESSVQNEIYFMRINLEASFIDKFIMRVNEHLYLLSNNNPI